MLIRTATLDDAKELLDIYTPYVINTDITFEYDVPSLDVFKNRMATVLKKFPYLVALNEDEKIIGYAYASEYRSRQAYQYVCELSIYIDQAYRHQHVGTLLYRRLIEILKELHYQKVYACITYPNEDSIAFHEKLGFSQIGYFKECGFKHDHWLDMVWLEKRINLKEERLNIINYRDFR
ncbi:MAG: N-acetyltransferase [Erysipelotrichaceae bacterium]|nr:N-acetyltransferase [Erysipelotrichaceae bacterium]